MRRGLFIIGIAVVVVGLILFAGAYAIETSPSSQTVSGSGYLAITPSTIGPDQVTVSWSGAPPGSGVYLTASSPTPSCPYTGSALAHGAGSSGQFSASLNGGTTYALFACTGSGSASSVTFSFSGTGFTFLMLIAVVVAALGAVIAFWGFRSEPKLRPSPEEFAEEPAAPAPAYAIPKPIQAETASPSSAAPVVRPAPAPTVGVRAEPPPPPRFMPASSGPAAPSRPAPAGGPRPPRTCAYCGTVNEAWITNCRKCKRPLSTTG